MVTRALALIAILAGACTREVPYYCDETTLCAPRYPDRPFCDLTGEYPASEGIGRTCIPAPWDAGIPDGGSADAGCVSAETCDGADNDCDQQIDEDWPDLGDGCSAGLGECLVTGVRVCDPAGAATECDAVAGVPDPAETCDNGLDDNCDGATDEGCVCTPSTTQPCGSDVGECIAGTQTCSMLGMWDACVGAIGPVTESCNGLDDDCDVMTDEGCPDVVTLLAPAYGAFTGSVFSTTALRPTFRWLPATGATSYEIQVDDSCPTTGFETCAFTSPEISATGIVPTTWQPAAALAAAMTPPVGTRYFWRVRACSGLLCSAWSTIRYLNVGRQESDFNGDGYADRIIGAPGQNAFGGQAFVYFGRSLWSVPGTVASADTQIYPPMMSDSDAFGVSVSSIGDINGDGYSDFVVGANGYDGTGSAEGAAYVYLGRSAWVATLFSADTTLTEPDVTSMADANFGSAVSGGGDANGDGLSDFAIAAEYAPAPEASEGNVHVYLGRLTLPPVISQPDVTIDNPLDQVSARFGLPSIEGDVNGDGLADVIVGAPRADNSASDEGMTFVYFGDSTWGSAPLLLGAADVSLENPTGSVGFFGSAVGTSGDLNGDGYGDLIVGASLNDNPENEEGNVFVFLGRAAWPSALAAPDVIIDCPADVTLVHFGASLTTACDFNADGVSDLAVGAPGFASNSGAAFIFYGQTSWPAVVGVADARLESGLVGSYAGTSIVCNGDVNGDGEGDLTIGAPNATFPPAEMNYGEGAAFMWFGAGWSGTVTSVDISFDDPGDFGNSAFGTSVD